MAGSAEDGCSGGRRRARRSRRGWARGPAVPVRMVRIPPRSLRILADVCPEGLSCRLLALLPASSTNGVVDCKRSGSMTVTIPTISAGPMQIATRVPPYRAPEDAYGTSKIPTIQVRRDRTHHIALAVVSPSAKCSRVCPAWAISIASRHTVALPDEPLHGTRRRPLEMEHEVRQESAECVTGLAGARRLA